MTSFSGSIKLLLYSKGLTDGELYLRRRSRHFMYIVCYLINLLPDMQILGYSNSAANKDMT